MSVVIPRTRIATIALRPVLFSGEQEGSLGGPTLPIPRMGDRFAADVATAVLRQDDAGRILVAALTEATTGDALLTLDQPNLPGRVAVGSTVVDGTGQGGSLLKVRGFTGGSVARGQYLSIVHGGVRYLHMATAAATPAGGKATLAVWPMLRFLTVDGEAVELDAPKIEGKLSGFDKGAAWVRNRVDPLGFTITERA